MPSSSAALLFMLGLAPLLQEAEQLHAARDAEHPYAALAIDTSGVPVVETLDEVLALAPQTIVPQHATWIRHRVRARERITQIAARYGVTPEDVIEWNHLAANRIYPKGYWRIRVRAKRLPPPRLEVRYVVGEHDEWSDIAAEFRVEQPDLRAWNWQRRSLWPGRSLTLWVDPGAPQTIHPDSGPLAALAFEAPPGATSKGYPDRGRLVDGVMLPDSELYSKRVPDHGLYGSTNTLALLHAAFATFRHDTGFEGEVVIGAISRRRGGRFHPHLSHQSGRDVDIRLPRLPGTPPDTGEPNEDEVDWRATWGLVRALADSGEVGRIFLEVGLHRRLYEAARQMGESREEIRQILQWPAWNAKGDPVVRHSEGHDGHIHVRFRCGPDEPKCRSRRRRPR